MKTAPKYSARVEPVPNPEAKIALVGEALGKDELALGRYFVGKAGQHLDSALASAGLSRADCYVTNVVKEQPPKTDRKTNDISVFVDWNKKVPFESDLYKAYVEELKEEFAALPNVNVVVALGGTAIYTLLQLKENPLVTKRRGSIYWSPLINKKVLCTLHPAYILYTNSNAPWYTNIINVLSNYCLIWDLMRAKNESSFPELRLKNRTIITNPTFNEVIDYQDHILNECKEVAFDTECLGGDVSCYALATSPTYAMSVPIMRGRSDVWNLDEETDVIVGLAKILENPCIEKLIHNSVFDTKLMFRRYGVVTRNIYDTMIAQAIILPDFKYPGEGLGKDLGTLVSLYCGGEPYYKMEGKTLFKDETRILKDLNYDYGVFWRYNAKDALVLFEIRDWQISELHKTGNWNSYLRQVSQVELAVFMGEFGQLMDVEGIRQAKPLIEKKLDQLSCQLKEYTGTDINFASTKQLQKYFYDEQKVRPFVKRRVNGESTPTLDEKALQRIAAGGGNAKREAQQVAKLILEMRKLSKFSSTYLDIALNENNRLLYDFNVVGTTSGRYSSDTNMFGEGQNAQNLTKQDYVLEVEEDEQ